MSANFKMVDNGCLMLNTPNSRWIIEHPRNGYFPTVSKMWDVLIEHPSEPHSQKLKFMGSFKYKTEALNFVNTQTSNNIDYFNAVPTNNLFYNEDYTTK